MPVRTAPRLAALALLPVAGAAHAASPLALATAPVGLVAVVVFVLAYA
jgi:hypothetical protein